MFSLNSFTFLTTFFDQCCLIKWLSILKLRNFICTSIVVEYMAVGETVSKFCVKILQDILSSRWFRCFHRIVSVLCLIIVGFSIMLQLCSSN